ELANLRRQSTDDRVDEGGVSPTPASHILALATFALEGEIKETRGDLEGAIAAYTEAVEMEDANNYTEPPDWSQPMRLYLGAALIKAGRAEEAEAVYRRDLQWNQQSGWSTFGLYQSLEAQGRTQEAVLEKRRCDSFWRNADVTLQRSRIMGDGIRAGLRTETGRRLNRRLSVAAGQRHGVDAEPGFQIVPHGLDIFPAGHDPRRGQLQRDHGDVEVDPAVVPQRSGIHTQLVQIELSDPFRLFGRTIEIQQVIGRMHQHDHLRSELPDLLYYPLHLRLACRRVPRKAARIAAGTVLPVTRGGSMPVC